MSTYTDKEAIFMATPTNQLNRQAWALRKGIHLSGTTNWDKYWENDESGAMGQQLRESFNYHMGQKTDLGPTIEALVTQKYSKQFKNLPELLQTCVSERFEKLNGAEWERGSVAASRFNDDWHYVLTSPGMEPFRMLRDGSVFMRDIAFTIAKVDRNPNTIELIQRWMTETLDFAPVHWDMARTCAFVLWTQQSSEERFRINEKWAVQYKLCSDEKNVFSSKQAFLSYVDANPRVAFNKAIEHVSPEC